MGVLWGIAMESLKALLNLIDVEWAGIEITYAETWAIPWTVPPGERDDYEIHMLEQGSGRFTVGGRTVEITSGDVMLLHSVEGNSFHSDPGDFRFVFTTFRFDRPKDPAGVRAFNEALRKTPMPLRPGNSTNTQEILYAMQRNLTTRPYGFELRLRMLLGSIVAELLDSCSWQKGTDGADIRHTVSLNTCRLVNEAILYLQDNFSTDVRLETLGKMMNLHPRYVCTLFSQATGKTISEFVRQLRIDKAKRLLLYTTLSITEIAFEVGFSNSQYFSRTFRQMEDVDPRTYRKTRKL